MVQEEQLSVVGCQFSAVSPRWYAFAILWGVFHLVETGISVTHFGANTDVLDWRIFMEERIHYAKVAPLAYHALLGLEKYLSECGIEEGLLDLMKLRASQINGCAYCLDMHWKDLRAIGESEQRMYSLDAWRESPYYTDRERAALAWTEAVTRVAEMHVPDEVYEEAKQQFSEKELADLTVAVATINAWNRLAIAGRTTPGTYQPQKELKQSA